MVETAVATLSKDGLVLSVDENFVSMFGFQQEEILSKSAQDFFFPLPYSTELTTILEELVEGNKILGNNQTVEAKHKDGSIFPATVSIAVMGSGIETVFVLQATKWSEFVCMITFHSDGTIIASNNAEGTFLFTDTELTQTNLSSLIPSLSFPKASDPNSEMNSIKEKMEKENCYLQAKRKDGTLVPIDAKLEILSVGSFGLFRGTFRKVDLSMIVIFILDRNEKIVQCNENFVSKIFGYKKEDLLGKDISALMPGIRFFLQDENSQKKRKLSLDGLYEPTLSSTSQFLHKSGMLLPISWILIPFRKFAPEIRYALHIQRLPKPITAPNSPTSSSCKDTPGPPLTSFIPRSRPLPPLMVSKYMLGERIGEGSYGVVKLATDAETKEIVAVKIIDKVSLLPQELERTVREIDIMKRLIHPNIVRVFDVVDTQQNIYIFMEYVGGGDLLSFCLGKTSGGGAPERPEIKRIFRQLTSAIQYCHSEHVIHRDIKHTNVLITPEGNVRLIDFGLGNFCKTGELLSTFCGSPAYSAPEMLQGAKYFGPEVDVWSLGVVLYSMLTGELPFSNFEEILAGRFVVPAGISEECHHLLSVMLTTPSQRTSIEEILNHPWFD